MFGFETHFGGGDGKLQPPVPQINIVPEPRAPKVVASSCTHGLEANLEARGSKFGDYLANKKTPKSDKKTRKNKQNFKIHKKTPNQLQPNSTKSQNNPLKTNKPKQKKPHTCSANALRVSFKVEKSFLVVMFIFSVFPSLTNSILWRCPTVIISTSKNQDNNLSRAKQFQIRQNHQGWQKPSRSSRPAPQHHHNHP